MSTELRRRGMVRNVERYSPTHLASSLQRLLVVTRCQKKLGNIPVSGLILRNISAGSHEIRAKQRMATGRTESGCS